MASPREDVDSLERVVGSGRWFLTATADAQDTALRTGHCLGLEVDHPARSASRRLMEESPPRERLPQATGIGINEVNSELSPKLKRRPPSWPAETRWCRRRISEDNKVKANADAREVDPNQGPRRRRGDSEGVPAPSAKPT